LDAGLVKNSFSNFSAEEYESQYGEEPSQTTFIVTGSAGMNFFKPATKTKLPTAPYPVPYYYEEEETYEQEAEPEPVLKFDPETGLPIEKEPELQFDPETGEPIELEENIKFDPETGEPIPAEDKLEYDPETGELIVPGLQKPVLEKVLLGGMKADLRLVDGISIADATSGYKKTATETYDLSTMNREAKRSMIITLSKRTLG
jgi:hypothetical protein